MNYLDFLGFCQKNRLKIFTIDDLKILFRSYSREYLRLKINRWQKKKYLKSLKRGLYIFQNSVADEFEIACKLIAPSYISLESALSHYSIIPDISSVVHCITTRNSQSFLIKKTKYSFHHIKYSLFTDFNYLRNGIFIASREKTILDFFYFRKPSPADQFFERLNQANLKTLNIKKLIRLAEKYPKSIQKPLNYLKNALSG